jgi:hypothetical protein
MDEIDPTNQSKFQGDLQILAAPFVVLVMATRCIHHPEWCADQSMKVSMYFQMLVAFWLSGFLAGWFV